MVRTRRAGLGEDFLASVDACFERLRREPQIYPAVLDPVHRAPLHRFPYATYYLVRPDHVDVLAVYHGRRRPRRFTNA